MKSTLIIPTYNRPKELRECLSSILKQIRLPDEIIVLDDGELHAMPLRENLEQKGIQCYFVKKIQKGLTRSRNMGVKMAKGDIIFFLDDDVVLMPDYFQKLFMLYESGKDKNMGGISGVQVVLKPAKPIHFIEFLYNIIFLIAPLQPGGVTLSGFSEQNNMQRVNPFRKLAKTQTLGGSGFSFHKKVFRYFMFAEDYADGHCQGEDKDFSFRVAQKFNLYVQPSAKLIHHFSLIERPATYYRGRDIILSAYRLFTQYIRRNRYEIALFYYSFSGVYIKFAIRYLLKRQAGESERLRGFLDALKIIRRKERVRT
jgi:glucosyl-dolichyl phosphate glucuronosyltransferase